MSNCIYPINPLACTLPVIVIGIGHEDNQMHMVRKEGFSFPQVFICKSGEGILKVHDKSYIIKKGYFFFLMSNLPHEYYGTTDKWEVEWISFSGHQIDDIIYELKLGSYYVGILGNINKIEALYHKIFISIKTDNNFGKIVASSTLYEILTELYCMIYEKNDEELSEGNSILNQIKQYIDENYDQNITLEDLTNLVHITPQYLCKLFSKYLHLRPMQYITMKRLQQAKKLLTDNKMSINDIAHMVGYNDCSYFSAVFKKYEMISPSEFRGL